VKSFWKEECLILSFCLFVGKQEYDKLAATVMEALVKRSYFKGSKKQIREAFDEVKTDKRNFGEKTRRLRESTTFSATLADVPFETCLEQTKAGAYSLRRTIRYLTKMQEVRHVGCHSCVVSVVVSRCLF